MLVLAFEIELSDSRSYVLWSHDIQFSAWFLPLFHLKMYCFGPLFNNLNILQLLYVFLYKIRFDHLCMTEENVEIALLKGVFWQTLLSPC